MSVCGFIDLRKPTAVERFRAVRYLAAGILLGGWAMSGYASVRLHGGIVEPLREPAGPGTWSIAASAAQALLAATVGAGARYAGWGRAGGVAEREVAAGMGGAGWERNG